MLVPDPASSVGERVKLLDFGIAKLFDVSLRNGGMAKMDARTRTGAILGTPAYMAPEQCLSAAQIDGQADVYSVGVIAYQMVTGRLPHDDEHPFTLMAKKLAEPARPLGPLGEDLPRDFPEFVAAMIATKPADRPRMDQVEDTLARMLGLNASRRSGFLGRAASPDQQAAAALALAQSPGPTRNPGKEAESDHEPETAPTVDGPVGEPAASGSAPAPPWLADPAARPGGVLAVTLGPTSDTLRLPPDGPILSQPATASAPVPMAGGAPLTGGGKRARTVLGLGIISGLLLLGTTMVLVASGRERHPLPAARPPQTPTKPLPELPKDPVPERQPTPQGPVKPLLPESAEPPELPSAKVDCSLAPTDASCSGEALRTQGHPAGLKKRDPRHPNNLALPKPGDVPGRSYIIEGVTVPNQESIIRMCAKDSLHSLRKLNGKSVIKLQRSGTLQVTSAPPAVLKSNLDECLRQLFLSTPVKSLPEEVTIRLTR